MSNNSVHKKIEARMGRPNARPIRATSGNVGTGIYVNTQYWRYVAPCLIPE